MPITQKETTDLRRACEMVVEIHQRLVEFVRAGITLAQIDTFVGQCLQDLGVQSAFYNYKSPGYPRFPSQSCLSVNDVIVHGTAGMQLEPLKPGDVISIDIGTKYRGFFGDAAWTYIIEQCADEAQRLCESTMSALEKGIEQLQPGAPLRNWAQTVQRIVETENNFHCVNGLGGHGLHPKLHDAPHIANVIPAQPQMWTDIDKPVSPGMILAVEPITAVGTSRTAGNAIQSDGRKGKRRNPLVTHSWPIRTADGSIACHYEHDILITDDGPEVLTAGLEELPIVLA